MIQIAARTFLSEKEYGLAVAYTSSAEDWPGLGRIVDCVLDAYFEEGSSLISRFISDIVCVELTLPCTQAPQTFRVWYQRLSRHWKHCENNQVRLRTASLSIASCLPFILQSFTNSV